MKPDPEQRVLSLAVERGLVSAEAADQFRERSRALGRPVLDLCVEAAVLTPEAIASLAGEEPARDRTLSLEGSGATAPTRQEAAALAFPVSGWDRYEYAGYLGDGGMGRVYKALDPRLKRFVALKFIRGDDARLVQRFKSEAQAQAQVEHEHVCKVYEVGEVEGRPYIAMQYIDGRPLDVAAKEMTLEQKLVVMRDVAQGLHAAHRTGLIHRDVKPSNVLVERDESGHVKAYVVDFGLARQSQSQGMTMSGMVVGTPAYMPPEQARGEVDQIDRRADVYGLGATLYAILAGRPPFDGGNLTRVLMQVLQDVPDPLHHFDPSLPADVDAIVMKCLRKDPRERYGSARAFAEDVDRYLEGEPVEARPSGVLYRLRMKAAKNRLAVAVGGVALALLAGSLAWGGYVRWTGARRAELAQAFGQQVERIVALARYAYMVPLHDVRAERARIRAELDQIDRKRSEVGAIAEGPARYALGRGAMTLGDWAGARRQLESAWNAGYHTPENAFALGQTMGELYARELREIEQMAEGPERDARRASAQATLRDPALTYLRSSRGVETEAPELVEALVAIYEGRYDDALERAARARQARPWLYEAFMLDGQIRAMRGDELGHAGKYAEAFDEYARGVEAYRAAARVGGSDPAVYDGLSALARAMTRTEINGRGGDIEPHFALGQEAGEMSLKADADGVEALVLKAGRMNRMAEIRQLKGQDARPLLDESIAASRRAIELQPDDPAAHASLGAALSDLGKAAGDSGGDPRVWLEPSIAAFRRSLELREDFNVYNDLGVVLRTLADSDEAHERPAEAEEGYRQAIAAYEASLSIQPNQVAASTNLGSVYFKLAPKQEQPDEFLDRAIAAFERSARINPKQMVVFYQMGRALDRKAAFALMRGEDPRPLLTASVEAYRKAIEINPGSAYRAMFLNGLAVQYKQLGDYARNHGDDPLPDYARAESALHDALAANPKLHFAHDNLGVVLVARGAHRIGTGRDPGDLFERGERSIRASIALKPDAINGWLDLAEVAWQRARQALARGADARPMIENGRQACAEALRIDSGSAEAEVVLARLATLEVRRRAAAGGDLHVPYREGLEALARARARAREIEADTVPELLARAELELWRARASTTRRTPTDDGIQAGLAAAEKAAEQEPGSAEAYLLRGALLAVQARSAPWAERATLMGNSDRALDRALELNRNLRGEIEASRRKERG